MFIISSEIDINHSLKSSEKVKEICKDLNAEQYINAIGGMDLYDKEDYLRSGIVLNFIKTMSITYKQFNNEFIPYLSILDVMMFNDNERVKEFLNKEYTLI